MPDKALRNDFAAALGSASALDIAMVVSVKLPCVQGTTASHQVPPVDDLSVLTQQVQPRPKNTSSDSGASCQLKSRTRRPADTATTLFNASASKVGADIARRSYLTVSAMSSRSLAKKFEQAALAQTSSAACALRSSSS